MTNSVRLSSVVLGMLLLASSAMGEQPAVGRSCDHAAQTRQNKSMRLVTWPLTAAQSHVSCTDRMLAIDADHARLTEILDRVAKCTGATIDAPAEADDVISTRLGPAPASRVLFALLDRTRFDFLITSAARDASEICVVKLMARSSTPAPSAPVPAPQTAFVDRAAQIANLTGGDEGDSDAVELGTPVNTSAAPVVAAERSPLPTPSKGSARKDPQ